MFWKDNAQSDRVTGESNNKGRPVGNISSRTGEGEGDDGTFRPPEGVKLTAVCSAAVASAKGFEAFDSGGVDAEGSGVERYVSLGEVAMVPCVA